MNSPDFQPSTYWLETEGSLLMLFKIIQVLSPSVYCDPLVFMYRYNGVDIVNVKENYGQHFPLATNHFQPLSENQFQMLIRILSFKEQY